MALFSVAVAAFAFILGAASAHLVTIIQHSGVSLAAATEESQTELAEERRVVDGLTAPSDHLRARFVEERARLRREPERDGLGAVLDLRRITR